MKGCVLIWYLNISKSQKSYPEKKVKVTDAGESRNNAYCIDSVRYRPVPEQVHLFRHTYQSTHHTSNYYVFVYIYYYAVTPRIQELSLLPCLIRNTYYEVFYI